MSCLEVDTALVDSQFVLHVLDITLLIHLVVVLGSFEEGVEVGFLGVVLVVLEERVV